MWAVLSQPYDRPNVREVPLVNGVNQRIHYVLWCSQRKDSKIVSIPHEIYCISMALLLCDVHWMCGYTFEILDVLFVFVVFDNFAYYILFFWSISHRLCVWQLRNYPYTTRRLPQTHPEFMYVVTLLIGIQQYCQVDVHWCLCNLSEFPGLQLHD